MLNLPQKTLAIQPKMLKWVLGICTTIYVVAFPILLGMAFICSMLALERSTETPFTIGVIVLAMTSLPLSVPVSIYVFLLNAISIVCYA
jgi:Na+-transporting NADH:ubiquinone oxidoreductase subunit NqrE